MKRCVSTGLAITNDTTTGQVILRDPCYSKLSRRKQTAALIILTPTRPRDVRPATR